MLAAAFGKHAFILTRAADVRDRVLTSCSPNLKQIVLGGYV